MTLPILLKPNKNFKLIRLGRENDGGYLIGKKTIESTKALISFGILDDCSFEKKFKELNPINIFCFDLINYKTYWLKRIYNDLGASIFNFNFSYFKNTLLRFFEFKNFFKDKSNFLFNKQISSGNLNEIIQDYDNIEKPILLKIDIEGSEYRLLDEIILNQNYLSGLIIEFHDVDLNIEKIKSFIKNFNLSLTHIHGNNYGSILKTGDPCVLELTFEKNPEYLTGNKTLPHSLDQPCNPKKEEIILNFS